ncbi:MAG: biopolymer transporter ExbD [Kiritimatiellia bacterium]
MAKRRKSELAELNLTPMIDVVFQLIIFFIVTIHIEENINEDITLPPAPHAPLLQSEERDPRTLVIEVGRHGWLYLHGTPVKVPLLQRMIQNRYNKYGEFPVLIRADLSTRHKHVRRVMDMCSAIGLWQVQFVAIKEEKM